MKYQLEVTRTNRRILEKMINSIPLETLNRVPEGFSNSIIWNIAHVVVTQQLLVYKLSGLPTLVSDEMIERYRKGTKTEHAVTEEELEMVKTLLHSTIDQTEKDMDANVFENYQEYPTSTGFVLKSLADAVAFNNFHEGIHLGYIMAMKKAL